MGKFTENKIYIIIPLVDAASNYAMLNLSTSSDFTNVRKNGVQDKYLFEAIEPADSVFAPYQWFSKSDMLIEMETAEWVVAEAE